MRSSFICIFVFLGLMSVAAWVTTPRYGMDGKTTLNWATDDGPGRKEQTELFNKLHPTLHLRVDPANIGVEKVIVQCNAGVGPELIDCYNASQLTAFVKSGVAWDVTDEMKRAGINYTKEAWPLVFASTMYNGRVYAAPTNAANMGLWFNKDCFDKLHMAYPKGAYTWKEFLPIAQRLTVTSGDGRVKQYGLTVDWFITYPMFIHQWGGSVYSPDGSRCTLDSKECIDAIQFMYDLVYKYKVAPNPAQESAMSTVGGWNTSQITLFAEGRVATSIGGRWWLCTLRSFKDLRAGVIECPHGRYRVFPGFSRSVLINKNSPRRQQAFEFLKYLFSEDYNNLTNRQADGLAAVKRFSYTDKFLHDPKYPNEDYNAIWRDTMAYSVQSDSSPFVNGYIADRIITKQLDLVRCNNKTVKDALRSAAADINKEIRKSIALDSSLAARYNKLMKDKGHE